MCWMHRVVITKLLVSVLCYPLVTICDLNGGGAGGGEGGGRRRGGRREGKGRERDKGKGEDKEGEIKREE